MTQWSAKRLTAAGAGLLALGGFCWFLQVFTASDGRHAWQGGEPPATVTLHAGRLYHLSTRGGIVAAVAETGSSNPEAFACTYSGDGGSNLPLSVTEISYDNRILHRVGSFIAPENGPLSIRCPALGGVFVDDATSSDFDVSGLLVIPTVLFGLLGVIVVLGGAVRLEEEFRTADEAGRDLGDDDPLAWSAPVAGASAPYQPPAD